MEIVIDQNTPSQCDTCIHEEMCFITARHRVKDCRMFSPMKDGLCAMIEKRIYADQNHVEYICVWCGSDFDIIHNNTDSKNDLVSCPFCGRKVCATHEFSPTKPIEL